MIGEIDDNGIIVENINTSHSTIDHPDRKSNRKHWT